MASFEKFTVGFLPSQGLLTPSLRTYHCVSHESPKEDALSPTFNVWATFTIVSGCVCTTTFWPSCQLQKTYVPEPSVNTPPFWMFMSP